MSRPGITIVFLVAACSGCGASPDAARMSDKPFERVPPPPPAVVGEVPDAVMTLVRTQFAADTTKSAMADLVRAEATVFNDGSLGCPEPGAFYTMATVPGYHVVFAIEGETFDYRVSESGQIKRCLRRALDPGPTWPPTQ